MTKIARVYASPITVVGVCSSVALSVALDVTGAASGVQSLLAGLTATTATLVLDGTARAERRFRLRTLLESADWLPSSVLSLAASTRQIMDKRAEPEIVAEARHRLMLVTEEFDELARGRITRPGTDYELLITGANACHRRMETVTNIPEGPRGLSWWESDIGHRYWQANLGALSRGVAITRVFICSRMDPDLASLIAEQSQAGVNTLVALRDGIAPELHQNLALWDGRRAWEGRMNAHGDISANVFTVNERDLQRLTTAFRTCTRAGRTVGA